MPTYVSRNLKDKKELGIFFFPMATMMHLCMEGRHPSKAAQRDTEGGGSRVSCLAALQGFCSDKADMGN